MSEQDLKGVVSDGIDAEKFLNNQQYVKAKLIVRAELFRQFEATKFKESDERDEIWRKIQSLEWIERSMNKVVRDGKLAEKTLLERIKEKIS